VGWEGFVGAELEVEDDRERSVSKIGERGSDLSPDELHRELLLVVGGGRRLGARDGMSFVRETERPGRKCLEKIRVPSPPTAQFAKGI
jgi:hypothetical protein